MPVQKDRPTSVAEYIALHPPEVQPVIEQVRAAIRAAAPQVEERISYNMPAYFLKDRLIYFDVHKHHIGFYPLTEAMLAALPELVDYRGSKSSVHFQLSQPMPYDLIRKMVAARVAEVQAAAKEE